MNRLSFWQAAMLRSAAAAMTCNRSSRALLVLIFHRVLAQPDPLLADEPDAATFAAQMDLVGRLFNVVDLVEGVNGLRNGSLPPRAVAITFDDGYANNLDVAAPILVACGLPATVFVTTGFIGGGCMWNDLVIEAVRGAPANLDLRDLDLGQYELRDFAARRRTIDGLLDSIKYLDINARFAKAGAIAQRAGVDVQTVLMMNEQQLRSLQGKGITIGAHCVRHPILCKTPDSDAREEIRQSKSVLEGITGRPVRSFAYPNGRPGRDYDARHVAMVREAGFDVAVSTAWGATTSQSDPLQVPRVAPWDRSAFRYGGRLVHALTQRNASACY
jgi:peptidoglycan/xylan/chitin deacetylase (PgdA/CDA1 family)